MFLQDGTVESVGVRETLRSCAFSDIHETILLRMKDAPLLAHRLRVGHRRREKSVPFHSSLEAGPMIVTVSSVGKAPWDKRVLLLVFSVTLATIRARTNSSLC